MANTIVIGGGTGLIGARLADMLAERGDEVRILSRNPKDVNKHKGFAWDARAMTIDDAAMKGVTHVVNLAGAGIADGRWSADRKKLIISSRTQTTALLAKAINDNGNSVTAYISASAIGYYGNSGESWVKEDQEPGEGFLSESTLAWEDAVAKLGTQTGVRTCMLRTGIVLSPDGGALEKMLLPAKFGVSGYFGDGQQWFSWIHLDDMCRIYLEAIDNNRFQGPINAVAPVPVRNKDFAKALARKVKTPAISLPVPAIGLKLAFGEMSHTILDSCRVSSEKLVDDLGFTFSWPEVEGALADLLE